MPSKFSQITPAAPGSVNDQIVGVKGGTTDALYSIAQVLAMGSGGVGEGIPNAVNIVTDFGADPTGLTDGSAATQDAAYARKLRSAGTL